MDFRSKYIKRFQQGMADILISRHNLRRQVLVSLRDVDHDIYLDEQDSQEEARVAKYAIIEMNPDMFFVQEQFDNFDIPDDILPFIVTITMSGMPRPLRLNDWVIVDGKIYVVSKVKPTNRELGGVIQCLVYPMRDSRLIDDPLAIYRIRFRQGLVEVPWREALGTTVVMELIYGGCPHWMSFDGVKWAQFFFQSRLELPSDAKRLYLMDADKKVCSLGFSESPTQDVEEQSRSFIPTI